MLDVHVGAIGAFGEELAAQFNYDLGAICAEMERRQKANGHKYATRRPVKPSHVKVAKLAG